MFKKSILPFFILFISHFTYSQVFEEGKHFISLGYGWGEKALIQLDARGNELNTRVNAIDPLFFKYEYARNSVFGVGVNFSYASANTTFVYDQLAYGYDDNGNYQEYGQYTENIAYETFSVLLRGNLHFFDGFKNAFKLETNNSLFDIFDPYFGVGVGYRSEIWNTSTNDPAKEYVDMHVVNPINFGFETTLGARFMLNQYVGGYFEIGVAKAIVQAGLSFRL